MFAQMVNSEPLFSNVYIVLNNILHILNVQFQPKHFLTHYVSLKISLGILVFVFYSLIYENETTEFL